MIPEDIFYTGGLLVLIALCTFAFVDLISVKRRHALTLSASERWILNAGLIVDAVAAVAFTYCALKQSAILAWDCLPLRCSTSDTFWAFLWLSWICYAIYRLFRYN